MNTKLKNHIKAYPTATLTEIKAYSETTYSIFAASTMGLLISLASPTLLNYMKEVRNGDHDTPIYLIDPATELPFNNEYGQPVIDYKTAHPAKQAMEILFMSLEKTNGDGRDFNFITTSNKGQMVIASINQLINVTMTERAAELEALLAICISVSNEVSYPFDEVTQIEVDEIKAELALMGDQPVTAVTYLGNQDKHVKIANEDVRLTVRLDAPVTVDTVVDFTLLIRNSDDQEFSPVDNWLFQITVPSGSTTATREITNTRKLTRHTQFTAKSNVLNSFTVEVTGA